MGFMNPASSSTKSLPTSGSKTPTTPQQHQSTTSLLLSPAITPTAPLPTTPTGTATPTPTQSQSLTTLPPTSDIDTSKPYISAALRHLPTSPDHASVLSGLSAWREKFSADSSLQESLKKIEALKNEDHMREPPRPRKPTLLRRNAVKRGPMDERVWLRRRERVSDDGEPLGLRTWPSNTSSASARMRGEKGDGGEGGERRDGEARARWDIRERGPLSPLSPTCTLGNSFGSGGFWDSQRETPSASGDALERPDSAATVIGTASEAEAGEEDATFPSSPYKPTDLGSRDIFLSLKRAIHDATLTHCATRLGNPSLLAADALIHPSLIKKCDEIAAAEGILAQKINALATSCPPPTDTVLDIHEEMKPFLSTEATVIGDYSILSPAELENKDAWLSIDDKRSTIATKLDTQLSLLRANWARAREEGLLRKEVSLPERELAWAVKFLADVLSSNKLVIFNSTSEEEEDVDDDGYSYQNFLHNMRGEANLPAGEVSPPWPEEMEALRPKIVPWTVITGDESEEEEKEEEEKDEGESEAETVRTTILFPLRSDEEGEEESPKGEKRARRRAPALGELESWAVEARGWEDEGEDGEGEEEIGVAL